MSDRLYEPTRLWVIFTMDSLDRSPVPAAFAGDLAAVMRHIDELHEETGVQYVAMEA